MVGPVAGGVVGLDEDAPALGVVEQLQPVDGGVLVGDDQLHQAPEVARHAGHGGLVEQVPVVLEPAGDPAGVVEELQLQVEAGPLADERHALDLHPGHVQGGQRVALVGQADLEDGRPAEVAGGPQFLDDPLEGDGLVGVGAQAGAAHALEDLAEAGVAGQAGADRQGVDEEPDQRLDLGPFPAGRGHAHDHVVLARVPVQQDLEDRQQRHVRGRAVPLADGDQGAHQRLGQLEGDGGAVEALDGGPGSVRRQFQGRGRPGQVAPPVGEGLGVVPGGAPALPGREVAVLDGEVGQRRGAPGTERRVEGGEFGDEDAHRPAVGDQVVHGQREDVVVGPQPQQAEAQQRAGGEVEGLGERLGDQARGLLLARSFPLEVGDGHLEGERGADELDGLAVAQRERGAQGLVPAHDLVEGVAQHVGVERAAHAQRCGDDVGGVAGAELVEEPDALLRHGEGEGGLREPPLPHELVEQGALLGGQRGQALLKAGHFSLSCASGRSPSRASSSAAASS